MSTNPTFLCFQDLFAASGPGHYACLGLSTLHPAALLSWTCAWFFVCLFFVCKSLTMAWFLAICRCLFREEIKTHLIVKDGFQWQFCSSCWTNCQASLVRVHQQGHEAAIRMLDTEEGTGVTFGVQRNVLHRHYPADQDGVRKSRCQKCYFFSTFFFPRNIYLFICLSER